VRCRSGGYAYAHPTSVPATAATGSSSQRGLLPTPAAWDGRRGPDRTRPQRANSGGHDLTTTAATLLPTPRARDGKGADPNPRGPDLNHTISLLPTPRATDGTKGGPNQRGSSGDLMLPSAVQLFKTPTSQLAITGGGQHPDERRAGGHGPTLADEVEYLLPTPTVADSRGTRNATARRKPSSTHHSGTTLTDVIWTGDASPPPSTDGKPPSHDQPPP
jgi:hypothetical protein